MELNNETIREYLHAKDITASNANVKSIHKIIEIALNSNIETLEIILSIITYKFKELENYDYNTIKKVFSIIQQSDFIWNNTYLQTILINILKAKKDTEKNILSYFY